MSGRILTLIGADGAGKTYQARRLVSSVDGPAAYIYMGSNPSAATHSLPSTRAWMGLKRLMRRSAHHSGPPEPRAVPKPVGAAMRATQHLKSFLVLGLRVSDDLYRLLLAKWLARRGHLVVLDRHPYADYHLQRVERKAGWLRWGDRLHGVLLRRVYPTIADVVLLDAPADVLHARKPEGTLAAVRARRDEYRQMIRSLPPHTRVTVIDVARPAEEVAAALLELASRAPSQRPQNGWSKATQNRGSVHQEGGSQL